MDPEQVADSLQTSTFQSAKSHISTMSYNTSNQAAKKKSQLNTKTEIVDDLIPREQNPFIDSSATESRPESSVLPSQRLAASITDLTGITEDDVSSSIKAVFVVNFDDTRGNVLAWQYPKGMLRDLLSRRCSVLTRKMLQILASMELSSRLYHLACTKSAPMLCECAITGVGLKIVSC